MTCDRGNGNRSGENEKRDYFFIKVQMTSPKIPGKLRRSKKLLKVLKTLYTLERENIKMRQT